MSDKQAYRSRIFGRHKTYFKIVLWQGVFKAENILQLIRVYHLASLIFLWYTWKAVYSYYFKGKKIEKRLHILWTVRLF